MVNVNFPVPEKIPGQLITDNQHLYFLKQHLAHLCGLHGSQKFVNLFIHINNPRLTSCFGLLLRFPGSQPVSFTQKSLELLETEDFWVCEKSDGVRVMVLIVVKGTPQGPTQEVYFIDRKDEFFLIENITFPHYENPNRLLKDTVVDGELVIDVDPKTGHQQLRFLAFDCIVWEANNLMMRPLMNRYGRLKDWVIAPLKKLINMQPHLRDKMPFDVKLKTMELAYGIDKVLHQDLPKLTHGNDGLIFTSATAPYRTGTDPKMFARSFFQSLKWKPPSENSIDFRLELRFPPLSDDPSEADFYAKPLFVLLMYCGKEGEQFFDTVEMSDEEWLERKERREQLDNRVVEVVWDSTRQTWKILRFRDDKKNGNYRAVVFSILDSIRDGVEAAEVSYILIRLLHGLIKRSPQIRQAWKARAQAQSSGNKSPHRHQQETNFKQNATKSPPRHQQETNSKQNATKSPPRTSNPSHSKSSPESRQVPQPASSGASVKPGLPATVAVNVVGGNPKTKGKKKKYSLAQVGSVAATMKRI
ncbi:mRNA guanylyltransferase [Puccinia sorghi]|uniref:mRNA guanylyltransferase n=1 Tax=Puccinia sorghi TaxID=27349 RepID=A0A0L6ULX4_9BASI|nr:mRNA guanylyltransferase [Puccinia sorghi]